MDAAIQVEMIKILIKLQQWPKALEKIQTTQAKMEQIVATQPDNLRAKTVLAELLLERANWEMHDNNRQLAHIACQRGKLLLEKEAAQSLDYSLLELSLRLHLCLEEKDTVTQLNRRLNQIGYRDTLYLQLSSLRH